MRLIKRKNVCHLAILLGLLLSGSVFSKTIVSVGGHDIDLVPPGSAANFSLIAIKNNGGNVKGKFIDVNPGASIHGDIDCLEVDGNNAWISGEVRHGEFKGQAFIVRVEDNGKSANDPADQISLTRLGSDDVCTDKPEQRLFSMTDGQVKIMEK